MRGMNKIVLFVILDQYADWESAYLSTALAEFLGNDVDVKTLSLTTRPVRTIGGFSTIPDYDIQSPPDDITALILVGGKSWKSPETKALLPLIKDSHARNIVIGAICGASEFLGAYGFLNNVKHTSNGLESILAWEGHHYNNSANYINEQSVVDGNIITANGTASLDFARDVVHALNLIDRQTVDEWYAFHKLGYIEIMKV